MSEETRRETLKTQFIQKLERAGWYSGAGALRFVQEAGAGPVPKTKFTTLFFNGAIEGDEQILENFSNQLTSPGTRVSSSNMDHGVVQLSINLTLDENATPLHSHRFYQPIEESSDSENEYIPLENNWEADFKRKVENLNTVPRSGSTPAA